MPDVPPDATDRARALFDDFIDGRWEQAHGRLREDMRGQADVVSRIARGWESHG